MFALLSGGRAGVRYDGLYLLRDGTVNIAYDPECGDPGLLNRAEDHRYDGL